MKTTKLQNLVLASMFAALCFVATYFTKVPSIHGYIHLGDCVVLLSGFILGPIYGGLSAGIGSMLSDLLAGCPSYIPGTFFIKALAAAISGLLLNLFLRKIHSEKGRIMFTAISGIVGAIIIVLGYLLYEGIVLHYGAGALSSVFGNIMQSGAGVIISTILYPVVVKISPRKFSMN